MSAEKKLRNNIDVLEELLRDEAYEMSVSRTGRRKGARGGIKIRVSIGQRGDWWSRGDGRTFAVALDRALRQFREDYYEMFEVEEPGESTDAIVILLEGL